MALPPDGVHNGGGIATKQALPPEFYIGFSQNIKGCAPSLP